MSRKALWPAVVIACCGAVTPSVFAAETICFEAESAVAVTAPVKVVTADISADRDTLKEASGGKCLEIAEGSGKPPDVGGEASFAFDVKEAGKFVLWARVWWMDSCGNSLTLVLDQGHPFVFGEDGTYKKWHWVKGLRGDLHAGPHHLIVENREDGVKIDQLLLTSDLAYVPMGIEDVTAGAREEKEK